MIETTIAGIPCCVNPTRVLVVKGNHRADNPDDYDGYAEVEFDVYDRKGYRAPWLERKITEEDNTRIENLILSQKKEY